MMIRTEEQIRRLAQFTSVMLIATAEALAADNQSARPARKVVVSLADRKLAVMEGGKVVKTFQVAVGAPTSPSPTGSYEIVNRLADPTYYGFGRVVPPGKTNPIGTRWIGLSAKGYGIHGTSAPSSIGHNVSHGCIRLRNSDVEELFDMLAVGDSVELYAEHTTDMDTIFGPVKPVAPASTATATVAQVRSASAVVAR